MPAANEKVLKTIGKKLLASGQSVSMAESVTAGLLQFAFSEIPDASLFLQGGITAYNLGQKVKHLHIEPLHAAKVDCVSQQVANEMALSVARLFTSDWSIAVTGYASPVEASGFKIFAYYAISYKGKLKRKGKLLSNAKEPAAVQKDYVQQIINNFAAVL